MPDRVVREIIEALKAEFRGEAVSIPIAMREEPAVTLFPALVEDEVQPASTSGLDALLGAAEAGVPGSEGDLLTGLPEPSEPTVGDDYDPLTDENYLFDTSDLDDLRF